LISTFFLQLIDATTYMLFPLIVLFYYSILS